MMKKIISLIVLFSFFLFPSIKVHEVLPSNPLLSQGGVSILMDGAVVFRGPGAVGLSFSPQVASAQNIGSLISLVNSGFSFTMDLLPGDTDPHVQQLQRVLNADVDTVIASQGPGSPGQETTYFGDLTKTAVIKFQNKYANVILTPAGLTVGNGQVNKLTRTKLNLLIGIFITYDSVGLPQNRAGSSTYVAPAVVPAPQGLSQTAICAFVNSLISSGVIAPNLANPARAALNCPAVTNLIPMVDIKVNGQNGPLTFSSARSVTVSWTSSNVTSCSTSQEAKPLAGSQTVSVTGSGSVGISCTGPYGTVSDSVNITINNEDEEPDSLTVVCLPYPASPVITGTSVYWVANSNGGNSNYTYSWSGTDNLSSNLPSATKVYTSAGTKTATVTVHSGNLTASNSCNLIVNTASTTPVATTTATTSLQVSCSATLPAVQAGGNINWTATATGGVGNYVYSWSGTDNLSGTSQSISKPYTLVGNKSATVNVTSSSTSATSTCIALVYPAGGNVPTASTTTPIATTTPPVGEYHVAHLQFSGVVSSVSQCYKNGNSNSGYKQVVVSSCSGAPVINADFIYNTSTGEQNPGTNNSALGVGSLSSAKFVWHSTDGHPLPQVGQTILGMSSLQGDAFSESCPQTSASGGGTSGTDGGWLLDYEVDAGSSCVSDSNCNSDFLQSLGSALFGGAFNSNSTSGCSSGGGGLFDMLNPMSSSNPLSSLSPFAMFGNLMGGTSGSGSGTSGGSNPLQGFGSATGSSGTSGSGSNPFQSFGSLSGSNSGSGTSGSNSSLLSPSNPMHPLYPYYMANSLASSTLPYGGVVGGTIGW